MKRRRFVGQLGAAGAALLVASSPGIAHAAEVEIGASLGAASVELGQSVFLQVQVSSTRRGTIGDPSFPGLEELSLTSKGMSEGVSVEISPAGRVRRSTKTFTYLVRGKSAGEHLIPIEVEVGGQSYKIARVPKLQVVDKDFVPQAETGKAGDSPGPTEADIIVWPVVDRSTVFIGQQLVYQLEIWERIGGNLSISAAPTFRDFWSENLDVDKRRRKQAELRQLGTRSYRVHGALRRALFAQKSGTVTIGGPTVEHQGMGGFFGPSTAPTSYVGRSLAIEVQPLPAKGQPPGFPVSNVGRFAISAEVDRSEIVQGEAIRLTVEISGVGNIPLIGLPELPEIPGVRAYEPKPETPKLATNHELLRGTRKFTSLLVVDEAGQIEIPPIELHYFDPEAKRYKVASSARILLEVKPNPDAKTSPEPPESAAGTGAGPSEDDPLALVIGGESLERLEPRPRWLTNARWLKGTLAAPALLGLAWGSLTLRRRFGPDDEARSRAQGAARRRKLLTEASAAVSEGEGFYPKLSDLLQSAAVGRAGAEGVGLTRGRLMALLLERGVPEPEVAQLRALLDACDSARFGADSGSETERSEHLGQARRLLGGRQWRAK